MVHQLDDNGTMAIVLPHGVLFRGGAEGHIREYLIKDKNYLDAVIGLPANIFYGTSIPTCILVLKKKRTDPEHVLFIDASQHYEKVKTQNVLRKADIDKIISTYENRIEEEKYSCRAAINRGSIADADANPRTDAINRVSSSSSSSSIASQDYNLNIPRYVNTFEEEDAIDLTAITTELRALAQTSQTTDATIADFCKELGIETPF
jgi:type I restriction enzyme M protein